MTYVIDRQHKQIHNQLGIHLKCALEVKSVYNVSLLLEQKFIIKLLIPLEFMYNKITLCIVSSKFK